MTEYKKLVEIEQKSTVEEELLVDTFIYNQNVYLGLPPNIGHHRTGACKIFLSTLARTVHKFIRGIRNILYPSPHKDP